VELEVILTNFGTKKTFILTLKNFQTRFQVLYHHIYMHDIWALAGGASALCQVDFESLIGVGFE
jgi:hypothetical protein